MNDITVLAAGKLSDPILMDWAIDRHRDPAWATRSAGGPWRRPGSMT